MKNLTQRLRLLLRLKIVRLLLKDCATLSERKCAAAFERYFLCLSKCVAASGNISMFFKEHAAASEKIFKKNVRLFRRILKYFEVKAA